MKVFCRLCLIFLMFSTLLRPAETEGASLTRIRAGYPSPSATFYPLFAAKEAGLLEKYGFDTEMIYVQGVQLIQVHVSGQWIFRRSLPWSISRHRWRARISYKWRAPSTTS